MQSKSLLLFCRISIVEPTATQKPLRISTEAMNYFELLSISFAQIQTLKKQSKATLPGLPPGAMGVEATVVGVCSPVCLGHLYTFYTSPAVGQIGMPAHLKCDPMT